MTALTVGIFICVPTLAGVPHEEVPKQELASAPTAVPLPIATVAAERPVSAPAPVATVPVALSGPRVRAICSHQGQVVFMSDVARGEASESWKETVSGQRPDAVCAFTLRDGPAESGFMPIDIREKVHPAAAAPEPTAQPVQVASAYAPEAPALPSVGRPVADDQIAQALAALGAPGIEKAETPPPPPLPRARPHLRGEVPKAGWVDAAPVPRWSFADRAGDAGRFADFDLFTPGRTAPLPWYGLSGADLAKVPAVHR